MVLIKKGVHYRQIKDENIGKEIIKNEFCDYYEFYDNSDQLYYDKSLSVDRSLYKDFYKKSEFYSSSVFQGSYGLSYRISKDSQFVNNANSFKSSYYKY